MAEELDVAAFDKILAAVKAECDSKGFEWPPPDAAAVGVANTVLRIAARQVEELLWLHAEAVWQRDRDTAELARWRSGQRRRSWPVVESVPDGLTYAAALARAQGTEGGDEHDELLRQAAIRLRDMNDAARVLVADRERERSSRQAWAEEAMRLQEKVNQQLGLLDCVHDPDPCWFDHHGGCQTHGFLSLAPGEVCPQREIADVLAEAEAAAMTALAGAAVCACLSDEQANQLASQPKWSLPKCAVHPSGSVFSEGGDTQ